MIFALGHGLSLSLGAIIFICVLVGFAGFVDAAAGGGGTISLPAYMIGGVPAHLALGCNKFSGACGTTVAVLKFWKSGALDAKAAIIAAAGSFIGSTIGAWIALMLSEKTIKTMLLFILPAAAVIIMAKRNFGEEDFSAALSKIKYVTFSFMIGFLIGGYDGMFGPGTGTFAIIAFSMLMKYDLKTASGNAKILNLASNYASLLTFALAGEVAYKLVIPTAICGVIGNHFGAHCALTKGAKFIRPMMLFVLSLLLIKIAWDLFKILN